MDVRCADASIENPLERLSNLATPPPHMSVENPIFKARKVEWGPVSERHGRKQVRILYICIHKYIRIYIRVYYMGAGQWDTWSKAATHIIYIYCYMCGVCVCVCVREREREREILSQKLLLMLLHVCPHTSTACARILLSYYSGSYICGQRD